MPLKKLFKKRHSLETSLILETNKELEKLKSSFDATRRIETIKSQSESDLMATNLDTHVSVHKTELSVFSSSPEAEEDISSKYEYIEQEPEESSVYGKESCSDIRRQSAPAESFKGTHVKTAKSVSYSEQQCTSEITTTRRRKCVSESQAGDIKSNDKNGSRTFQLDEGKLENMIGQCINRIIKESILTAVKNVNVDGICEEIIENISNQRHGSTDFGPSNDEKYLTDLDKYVELDESNLNYKSGENGELDSFLYEDESAIVSNTETHSLGGYSADLEESISVNSTNIELKDQTTANKNVLEVTDILTDTIPPNTVSKEAVVKENYDVESASSVAAELASPVDLESERTNVIQETKILEHSFKNDSIISSVKTAEQENENIISRNEHNIRSLENATEIIKDHNAENDILNDDPNLMIISGDSDSFHLPKTALSHRDSNDSVLDSAENLIPSQTIINEEKKTNNWKAGYLRVKLPHKERGKKAQIKAWKKRCVSIQADEFVNDPKNPCLMLSLYSAESGTARKHGATFWKSISCHKAAVYRSSSRSHKYAFTISDNNAVVIHLAAESETSSQEWMAAIRSILWPPSPVLQLEKMLYGKQFEISIVDNEFSFRAGLLGMYGYLTITGKKLILVHPQQGYVIQEWYLNTVDKFELIPQSKIEDAHKVLCMTTCSDSSTGKGEIVMYCPEAVAMLQSIASTIHQILTVHIEQKGGKYDKELAEIADWLVPTTSQDGEGPEDYYKVPPRQVKSLLDIPNFIFDKPLTPSTTVTCCSDESIESKSLETAKTNATRASQDSGISAGNTSEDVLNCSSTSFLVGGGRFPGKSSDSELSDSYTPPRSPIIAAKQKNTGTAATLQVP